MLGILLSKCKVGDIQDYNVQDKRLYGVLLLSDVLLYSITQDVVCMLFVSLLLVSAYTDLKCREIPDTCTLIGLLLVGVYFLIHNGSVDKWDIIINLVVYVLFFIAGIFGILSGGDVKILLPTILMLFTPQRVFLFMVGMSISAVVVVMYGLFIQRKSVREINSLTTPMAVHIVVGFAFAVVVGKMI